MANRGWFLFDRVIKADIAVLWSYSLISCDSFHKKGRVNRKIKSVYFLRLGGDLRDTWPWMRGLIYSQWLVEKWKRVHHPHLKHLEEITALNRSMGCSTPRNVHVWIPRARPSCPLFHIAVMRSQTHASLNLTLRIKSSHVPSPYRREKIREEIWLLWPRFFFYEGRGIDNLTSRFWRNQSPIGLGVPVMTGPLMAL
jgi:hypothetical protein